MCYYITVAFTKTTANSILTSLPKKLNSLAVSNPSISKLLPKDYEAFAIITAMCSCDLYSSPGKLEEKVKEKDTLRRKYKKKGWSENKIQRAIEGHEKNMKGHEGFRDDFLNWLTVSVANLPASLFVFVHMYSGDIETEELNIGREKVKVAEFGSFLRNFPADVLVEVKN